MPRRAPLVAFLTALAGCSATPPAPEITRVTPGWGWLGETTDIVVEGANFYPNLTVDAGAEKSSVDEDFRVSLGTEPETVLSGVSLEAYDRLRAEVPAGLDPGVYAVRVRTPDGQEASLDQAFEVRDTRADRLELRVASAAASLGVYTDVTVSVLDPNGGLSTDPAQVRLVATSARDAGGVAFDPAGLDGQASLDDAVGVEGSVTGAASVRLTSTIEDDVTLTATSPDNPDVGDASLVLTWYAGQIGHIEVDLLDDDAEVTAGGPATFDIRAYDTSGVYLADGYDIDVALALPEGCGRPSPAVLSLAEPGPYTLTFTTACAAAVLSAQVLGLQAATSDPFTVVPGPPSQYGVDVSPSIVSAGNFVTVTVVAEDAWGNAVAGYEAISPPALHDNVGGIDSAAGIGDVTCSNFELGEAACLAYPTRAHDPVLVVAEGPDGLSGTSNAIKVQPGAPAALVVDVPDLRVRAGDDFPLSLSLTDAWGNVREIDPEVDVVRFQDDTGSLSCTYVGPPAEYECVLTTATPGTRVGATVDGVSGEDPEPVVVENGALARVDVEVLGVPATAGEDFELNLDGFDAWDNPYTVAVSGMTVDLSDTTGTLSPAGASLNAAGQATVAGVITRASTDVAILVGQGGVTLGRSGSFQVRSAPLAGLSLTVPPWVDVDEGAPVIVTAVDAYGNTIVDYAGVATVEPVDGLCDEVTVESFSSGVAATTIACQEPGLQERFVVADEAGYTGSSSAFDVLDFGCAAPPVAALALEGADDAVVCLSGATVDVTADAAGSTGSLFHVADTGGAAWRTLASTQTLTYDSPGITRVTLVSVDADACAAIDEGYVYVGEPDGSATGPVTVTVADPSVRSGLATTVTATATTCSGDLAAGATVRVWADLGTPGAVGAGEGLELTLDAAGAGRVGWSFDTGYAGTATFYVGSPSGSAYGAVSAEVTGDSVRPMLTTVSPTGQTSGLVSEVVYSFTEPLLATSVDTDTVGVVGPFGDLTGTVTLSSDATVVTFTPTDPIDASADSWRPVVSQDVRDAAGIRLSGDWSGSAADWTGLFGMVASTLPALDGCAVGATTFTPDGDDGPGIEADNFDIVPLADSFPAWWRLTVTDADGAAIRTSWVDGTAGLVSWDGRGDDGIVAAAGTWLVSVVAVDAQGNEAEDCNLSVALRRQVDLP